MTLRPVMCYSSNSSENTSTVLIIDFFFLFLISHTEIIHNYRFIGTHSFA